MRFLMGTLFGLVISLVASRVLAWRKAPAAGEEDCASQLEEAEARRDALRARFQRKLKEPDAEVDAPAPAKAASLAAQDEPPPAYRRAGPVTDDASATPDTRPPSPKPDDLTKIEGIGPKIAGLLKADGIETFSDLAGADTTRLSAILEQAGSRYRLADPSTWSEQAALAADAKWDALDALQNDLKGGRRV